MGKVKIENKKVGLLDRVLNSVERVGNKLPDPVTIFFILCGVIFVLSTVFLVAMVALFVRGLL